MFKKISIFLLLAAAAYVPFNGVKAQAAEDNSLARVYWNININTGFYPCYAYPCPYYYYPYPPPCAYPCPPPYWVW